MITTIEVSREDFEASIKVVDVFDDSVQIFENTFYVSAKNGKIEVVHDKGCLPIGENGTLSEYSREIVKDAVRVFKAIYPSWKEW